MKKKLFTLIIGTCLTLTGCVKSDNMEDIKIKTTSYPIEYITTSLYSEHAYTISSIYPDDIDIDSYKLTDKQLKDYSKNDLFIYNGASSEPGYAIDLLNTNKKIKIIDAAKGMDYTNSVEELWLDPFNFLMLAQNIKSGFNEYISDPYLEENIQEKYDELNIAVSKLDVELKTSSENAVNKTIVVSDDLFKYLEKYQLNVISLEENDNLNAKIISDVKNLINAGTIEYIFIKNGETTNETINNIINQTGVKTETLHTLSNLTEIERDENQDYLAIMKSNIEKLQKELYK